MSSEYGYQPRHPAPAAGAIEHELSDHDLAYICRR
jgi:hypothetical protein